MWQVGISAFEASVPRGRAPGAVAAGDPRVPLPAKPQYPRRVAYVCERAGTAALLLFYIALSGWGAATTRKRCIKTAWALEVARLLEGRYAG